MRIISGFLKGRSINFLKNANTRPLKDSVRESIFNMGLTLDPTERLAEKLPIEINLPGGGKTKVNKPKEREYKQ